MCNVGIQQEPSCGPIVRLMIVNKLLENVTNEGGFKIIAFADDIMVILQASAFSHFKDLLRNRLRYYRIGQINTSLVLI